MSIHIILLFFASIRNKINFLREGIEINRQRYRELQQYREFQRRQGGPIRHEWQSRHRSVSYIFIPSVENTYQYDSYLSDSSLIQYEPTEARSRRSFCGRYWCIICCILFIISIACIMTTFFRLKKIAETTSVPNSTTDFTTETN